MKRNAIILAAGKSNRFAPFTYEKPKGLFCVRGEILLERQIMQLKEAGVEDIYVVVGYMKEKFFYLEAKYGIHLIVNNDFSSKGNLYSLYVARDYLENTYVCCADHYFVKNPFLEENPENKSFRLCSFLEDEFREFGITCSDANIITSCKPGGANELAMVGCAYMNKAFSKAFKSFLEEEINDFRISSLFWEEFYARHADKLSFFARIVPQNEVLEFDSIDDLRKFDSDFLLNVDSEIIDHICQILSCEPNQIKDISVIDAGLTNVSFAFKVHDKKYVYRHPGGTAGNLIDRRSELYAQNIAKKYDIDPSVIYMDKTGWKISYFIKEARNCDIDHSTEQLDCVMRYLRRLHETPLSDEVKTFDNIIEGDRLMQIASATKGNLKKEFKSIILKVHCLYQEIVKDAERLGYKKVLCHNDTYAPNFLYDSDGKIYLIDWEYAGLNYAANDIGCMLSRYDYPDEQIERFLRSYIGRDLTEDEHRFFYGFLPISAYYWFCWGLYKGSVGDDDSFFFLPSYRNLIRFLDKALDSYGVVLKEVF